MSEPLPVTPKTPRDSERVARVLFDALRRDPNAHVQGEPEPGEQTTVDGHFYLNSVARRVIREVRAIDAPIATQAASRIAALEAERDKLIGAVAEHVTARGEYYARAEAAEAEVAALKVRDSEGRAQQAQDAETITRLFRANEDGSVSLVECEGCAVLAARVAKLEGVLPDPDKLELLADLFDKRDETRRNNGETPSSEVQNDLRRWACNARAALTPTQGERYTLPPHPQGLGHHDA